MKKLLNNLPFRLLLGIVIGIILGQVFPLSFMRVVVTLQYIMGQLITFCVPLIIIGFIAPSITKLGKNASRLLGVAVVIAYVSSICAAFMSTGAGYALIPLDLHFQKGRIKAEIGLAKGKKQHDKRDAERDRDWEREKARLMRSKVS